jgi:hypothetical protein
LRYNTQKSVTNLKLKIMKQGTIVMKRDDIKDCPQDATHAKLNPSGEFIELFYKVDGTHVQYKSTCGGGWFFSDAAEKDSNFLNRLTPIA